MKKQTTNRRNNMNTQAACRTAYAANASGTMIAKIAGISTAAVLAVSIPVILHNVNNSQPAAGSTSSVSQKNEISASKTDKYDNAEQTTSEVEAVSVAAETSEASEAEILTSEGKVPDSSTADSSAAESVQVKTTREANLEAIDGSHIFSTRDREMSFDELYSMGCANASNDTEGLAMAMIGEHGGMNKVYHTVFYTTDNGNEWKQLEGYPTVPIDDLQYFALDNGDIVVFRYGGAMPAPTINIFSQSAEDPSPYCSGEEFILDGKVLDDGYTISYDYAPYDFTASYYGGDILHIDVTNDSDINVGSFDIDIYDHTSIDNTAPAEADSTYTTAETAPVDMTVDKLLSTDVDTLLAMSNNDYEFVLVQGQCEKYGFKCAAFPNYIFTVDQQYADGKAEGPFDAEPYYDSEIRHIDVFGKEIQQVDLYEGAYIGEGVTVGMTYNDIKEALGGELKVHINNSSIGYSADVEINGRIWMLHFDLTDEQTSELRSRIVAATDPADVDNVPMWDTYVDISDMDPTCDMAIAII